ncbi:MAG: NnrU family protein [Desulfobacterales bacterium]|nr:NnrU family protein [Desulfobacterales bacterium]
MGIFVIGLIIFFGIHSISIVNEPWRDRMVDKIGEWPWKGLYSLGAIFGFILMIWGYGVARSEAVVLYTPPPWLQHISLVLLLPVFPLLIAAYFPGRIKEAIKHPMLTATKLWAVAHLFTNGSLVGVILFGSFLAWAVWDRISVQRRLPRPIPGAPPAHFNDIVASVFGIGLYFAFFFWLHALLIGVSPL